MKTAAGIAFDDLGDGDTALLLMPGWCGPRTVFQPLLGTLGMRAIAIDWRGHGASAEATSDFGFRELAGDAVAVLETAGVRRVIPVGLSHAGWAAIDLRRALGADRVPGMVWIDWMVLGAPPPFFGALAALQGPQWSAVRDQLFAMWTTGVDAAAVHAYIEQMRVSSDGMWQRAGREIAARFAAEPVPLVAVERDACPTLHVYAQPADDGFLAAQRDYAASHPWFSVKRIAARSHFPMLEAPGEVARAIRDFTATL